MGQDLGGQMSTPGFDILWIWVSEPPSTGILRSGKGTLWIGTGDQKLTKGRDELGLLDKILLDKCIKVSHS